MSQQTKRSIETFQRAFRQFIKPHQCRKHSKIPTFICIEKSCKIKSLTCESCFTCINGQHKGHDYIDITKFLQNNLEIYRKNLNNGQIIQMLEEIQDIYDGMITIATNFLTNIQNLINNFINKKNVMYKQSDIFVQKNLQNLRTCSFATIEQMNQTLNILSNRVSSNSKAKKSEKNQYQEKMLSYLEDLNYQNQFLVNQIKKIQDQISNLMQIKNTSPLVKKIKPTFSNPTFIKNNQTIYLGQSQNQIPNGKGILYNLVDKKMFFGNFVNGYCEGKCQQYYQNGDYYFGQFKQNKKSGRGIYMQNGKKSNIYEGQFEDSKMNGKGVYYWNDGSRYQGYFKNNNQDGFGIMFRKNGKKEYEGNWVDGMFQGYGIQYLECGGRYQGQFKKDKLHGVGTFYRRDSIYHGIWKQNELVFVQQIKQI